MPGTIVVHADPDVGYAARRDSGLAVARLLSAHLRMAAVETMPMVAVDPLGGAWTVTAIEDEREALAAFRARVEADFANEDVPWDWVQPMGDVATELARLADLADLLIVSRPDRGRTGRPVLPIMDQLAVEAHCPLLSLAAEGPAFAPDRPALVAWNGMPEAARALRSAVPLLKTMAVVTVMELLPEDRRTGTEAAAYLSRHGIHAELVQRDSRDPGAELLATATSMQAGLLVMGAYGHSRLRETIMGGVTHDLLRDAGMPILTAH